LVDDERVQAGKQKLAQHRAVLNRVEQAYGVPAETVGCGVWKVTMAIFQVNIHYYKL
jgi:membrane-bound lytic murein transglycosylase B